MSRRSFGVSFRQDMQEVVVPVSKERRTLGFARVDFWFLMIAKVSCRKPTPAGSPSKRPRGFMCGSGYSHNDRVRLCGVSAALQGFSQWCAWR